MLFMIVRYIVELTKPFKDIYFIWTQLVVLRLYLMSSWFGPMSGYVFS